MVIVYLGNTGKRGTFVEDVLVLGDFDINVRFESFKIVLDVHVSAGLSTDGVGSWNGGEVGAEASLVGFGGVHGLVVAVYGSRRL